MLLAALMAIFLPKRADAWGNDGHRVVGEIAWHYLTPDAEQGVRRLLVDKDFATLAATATWADTYARGKPRYDFAKRLHYVNVPATAERYQELHCRNKCVVSGIRHYSRVLKDHRRSSDDHVEALRFLSHFVGDLHQPLHVAHPDNVGGNKTEVVFLGREQNAHWVWDTGIVTQMVRAAAPGTDDEREVDGDWPQQPWRWLAYQARVSIDPAHATRWADLDPAAWATETLKIAQAHAYLTATAQLDLTYVSAKDAIVTQQLQKAGVRLATILNRVFSNERLPKEML